MGDARRASTSARYLAAGGAGGDAWAAEARAEGRRGTQRIVQAGEVPAPELVAERLGLEPGQPVVARRRIMPGGAGRTTPALRRPRLGPRADPGGTPAAPPAHRSAGTADTPGGLQRRREAGGGDGDGQGGASVRAGVRVRGGVKPPPSGPCCSMPVGESAVWEPCRALEKIWMPFSHRASRAAAHRWNGASSQCDLRGGRPAGSVPPEGDRRRFLAGRRSRRLSNGWGRGGSRSRHSCSPSGKGRWSLFRYEFPLQGGCVSRRTRLCDARVEPLRQAVESLSPP